MSKGVALNYGTTRCGDLLLLQNYCTRNSKTMYNYYLNIRNNEEHHLWLPGWHVGAHLP